MAHGSEGLQTFERSDPDCLAAPVADVAWIALEHWGAPLECTVGNDGPGDDPERRLYACYWAQNPDEGLDYPAGGTAPVVAVSGR